VKKNSERHSAETVSLEAFGEISFHQEGNRPTEATPGALAESNPFEWANGDKVPAGVENEEISKGGNPNKKFKRERGNQTRFDGVYHFVTSGRDNLSAGRRTSKLTESYLVTRFGLRKCNERGRGSQIALGKLLDPRYL